GGGKTHALIAMYHKAAEWNARCAVIVGTPLAPTETLWGLLAEQLTGHREGFTGPTAPGRESLRVLLEAHQPLLILMDEVLEYATKAAGVPVGSSTLAAQTLAFIQELTEAAATLDRTCLVVTLPSSLLEHYDEGAERLFHQLQKVAGRVEKIYTPVQEHEITHVIRRRLFSSIRQEPMQRVVDEFLTYAAEEALLPAGVEPSEYRRRFEAAYPFLPEVVDVLYQRWGSFTSFQRTRGVLRLLSLVVHALKESAVPYITLADFDLANQEIRRELLKHIGPEYDSVIAADITGEDAGARKVDGELGAAYQGLRLGTRVATMTFLYSFSGGVERGATLSEVKRNSTTTANPSSVVAEAVELFKNRYLFYLQYQSGKYFFTNQANLNRILLTRMENVEAADIRAEEEALLKTRVGGRRLRVFLWPTSDADIPDTPDLKLILLRERDDALMTAILKQKGVVPRVHCNALLFLVAQEGERPALEALIRRRLALEAIAADPTVRLSADQAKEAQESLKKARGDLAEAVRRAYRQLLIPARDGLKELDLGIPTYGEDRPLDEEVYDKLRLEGEVLERIAPLVIRERYLREQECVMTEQLAQAGLRTPGEARVVSREAWEAGIAEGVRQGLFGLGSLEGDQPVCRYFKEEPFVGLAGGEVIIRAEVCQAQLGATTEQPRYLPAPEVGAAVGEAGTAGIEAAAGGAGRRAPLDFRRRVRLHFTVPKGKVSGLTGVMNLLQYKFGRLDVTLVAEDGEISEQEYEDKVREAFRQLGVEVVEE
ncbi:MAG: DUF499 domain-containing protein, partial [Candidatus Oleimicrobiaceae bacterium]